MQPPCEKWAIAGYSLKSETDKYPEILADLRDELRQILIAAGADAEKAGDLSMLAAERMRHKWGGMQVYICKGRDWQLSSRDHEIFRRWNGVNKLALCQEYNISAQRLYQICAMVRKEEFKKRQGKLF